MNSIAQALVGQPTPPQQDPRNPFLPNHELEAQVAPIAYPVNPLILALAQKFGMTNLIRNAQNQKEATLDDILK